jgi:hypothetical protein
MAVDIGRFGVWAGSPSWTPELAVATAIVNMWASPAAEVAAFYHRAAARHPGRFLLGVDVGHHEHNARYRSYTPG